FSSRRRHTISKRDWSSDVCSSDLKQKGFDNLDYKDVMTEPLFAPETAELGDLLMEMQQTQRQLAILTDEYGGVTGLATIEDLVRSEERRVGNWCGCWGWEGGGNER